MLRLRLIAFVLLLACSAFGATKAEQDLQVQLTAALKEKAVLQEQLASALQASDVVVNVVAQNTASAKKDAKTARDQRDVAATTAAVNARAVASAIEIATLKSQAAIDLANAKTELAQQRATNAVEAATRSTDGLKYGMYSTLGVAVVGLLMAIIKIFSDRDDRSETRNHRVVELDKIDASARDSTDAINKSNHLTQKIVDMREDLVKAVAAVAPGTPSSAPKANSAASGRSWLDLPEGT